LALEISLCGHDVIRPFTTTTTTIHPHWRGWSPTLARMVDRIW
jgi:hypothetical protein